MTSLSPITSQITNPVSPMIGSGSIINTQPTPSRSATFPVLAAATPSVSRATIQMPTSIPLSSTPLAAASLTGLVSPNAQVVSTSSPVTVNQTVNTPVIPINNLDTVSRSSTPGRQSPSIATISGVPVNLTDSSLSMIPTIPVQVGTSQPRMTPNISRIPFESQIGQSPNVLSSINSVIPVQQTANPSPLQIPTIHVPTISQSGSPTARSAVLTLSGGSAPSSPRIQIPSIGSTMVPTASSVRATQGNLLFPSLKVNTSTSNLPLKSSAELMNQEFEIRDYQGIIQNASIENELLNAGYAPVSRIVVRADNGDKRTQYIKAINKKGQKVFILLDSHGYTTARSTDLTLIEAHSASIVPYSLKTGAYECAGKDVCGVAFECGADAVCILSRGSQDLTPKEANFIFVEQQAPTAASIEVDGSVMTYPVIRLTEIRANPALVLVNTDTVTRRLRNTSYSAELTELSMTQQSINKLNASFIHFDAIREATANKLYKTLAQLEKWNEVYIANPPVTDEYKDKYRRLQYNLAQRNEDISTLLRIMKKIADKRIDIDVIINEINELNDFAEKEFANIEFATSE